MPWARTSRTCVYSRWKELARFRLMKWLFGSFQFSYGWRQKIIVDAELKLKVDVLSFLAGRYVVGSSTVVERIPRLLVVMYVYI